MLTLLRKIFTWWNQDTFGTRIKTIFFGKLVGTDELGNKYYESKNGKRWVIYSNTIDASKIPVEWYSWIHFTPNKIEKKHTLEKYEWQKPHQENLTGTDAAYYPNKNKNVIDNDEEYQTLLKPDGTSVKVKTSTLKNSKVVRKNISNNSLLKWLGKKL